MVQNKMPWESSAANTTASSQDSRSTYTGSGTAYSDSVGGSYVEKATVPSTTEAGTSGKRYGLAKPVRKYIRGDLKSD